MASEQRIDSLQTLIDRLCNATRHRDRVRIGELVDAAGRRSFGPLLLFLGLIVLSPLSGIPGLPTIVAVMVLAIAVQFFMHRQCFWLPRWVLARRLSRRKVSRALQTLRPAARIADGIAKPRLLLLIERPAVYAVAALCVLISLSMPPLELVPFANSAAGAALSLLGLSLTVRDGLLAAASVVLCVAAAGLGIAYLI